MKIYFVRHGETDWGLVESRGARGWAKDFAPLTQLGRLQIDTIARDYRLQEAEAILCSTFTRALESAALLSRALNKPLFVEYDLHEWLPQKDPLGDVDAQLIARAKTASAQQQVMDAMKSIDMLDPTTEIGRFEEKIRREEAKVLGQQELAASSLDAQFEQLADSDKEVELDARLAALKAGGDPQKAVTSGE